MLQVGNCSLCYAMLCYVMVTVTAISSTRSFYTCERLDEFVGNLTSRCDR